MNNLTLNSKINFNYTHLHILIAFETLYIVAFYIFYSTFVDSLFGLTSYNYTMTNYITYIILLSLPLTIFNLYKAYQYKKDNKIDKSKNFIIVQIIFILTYIIF